MIELKNDQLAKLEAGGVASGDPATAIPAQLAAQAVDAPEADIEPALEGAPATAVPPAPVQGERPASTGERNLQALLGSPMLMGLAGGAAVLLLLLLLLLARRRKALQAAQRHERMARELEDDTHFASDLDLPESDFAGLEVPPPSPMLDEAPAPAPAPAPAAVIAPVIGALSLAKPGDDVLVHAERLIELQQLDEAVTLLSHAIEKEPQRSDLRLKLMQVYGEQGEREAFIAQERQLVANGKNHAEVEQLKARYPAMLAAAATGIATAAVAAQLEEQFVDEMLRDDSAVGPEFDHDFDLSLDELETASPTELLPAQPLDQPVPDYEQSFEEVLKQQAEVQAPGDGLPDLDLSLPADFDLSLAPESEVAEAEPDSFSIELDKVNAELQRLSQSLEQPSLVSAFADDPEPDFLSGSDEAATKLDLAEAYIDMGDDEGARDILAEVIAEGNPEQQAEALEMLSRLV